VPLALGAGSAAAGSLQQRVSAGSGGPQPPTPQLRTDAGVGEGVAPPPPSPPPPSSSSPPLPSPPQSRSDEHVSAAASSSASAGARCGAPGAGPDPTSAPLGVAAHRRRQGPAALRRRPRRGESLGALSPELTPGGGPRRPLPRARARRRTLPRATPAALRRGFASPSRAGRALPRRLLRAHLCVVSLPRCSFAFRIAQYSEWVSGLGVPLEECFGDLKHCA